MTVSVITPTHNVTWLQEAYQSLVNQTLQDWEWVIVPNHGAVVPDFNDDRVVIIPFESDSIGALKRHGFMAATGEWLVELDHDDLLAPTALEEIASTQADFVYSNCVEIKMNGDPHTYNASFGWKYREGNEAISPLPYPSNLSRIWFAPNHVRAWRSEFYRELEGHDLTLPVCDDHDLVCRSYLAGNIARIDKPLYTYRVHGENTWLRRNEEIQIRQWENHDKYLYPITKKWSKENDLRVVDLGGAIDCPEGFESYDRHNADIIGDLNEIWQLENESCGLLRAHDVIEHLENPIHTMNEAWRVLAHGGILDILVPSTKGEGAWCDPTHISFWNKRSFKYYTEPQTRRYIEPECYAKFQIVKLIDLEMWDEKLPYVQAQLVAIKDDGPRIHGWSEW